MAMNYNANNQFYLQDLQGMRDRIDRQISQMQQPMPTQQAPITQNFQLMPSGFNKSELDGYFAKNIEDVKNKLVFNDAIFVDKDFTIMWKKDISGNIKTFTIQEVIELDEKDKQILNLQKQIEEMKELIISAKNDANVSESTTSEKPSTNANNRTGKK